MGYSTRSYARGYISSFGLPPGLRWLLIANIGIFVVQFFTRGTAIQNFFDYCELVPAGVVKFFFVWQLVTYMFLHGGIMHLLWNMLALWMFGRELEAVWGTRRFLQFYFFCGTGAGICVIVGEYLFGNPNAPTLGSSGAIYGILLASAVLWPDRELLFYFLIPVKMKYFVAIIGAIAFFQSFNASSTVSNVAHLGGMLFAYAFLKLPKVRGVDPLGAINNSYRSWKLARAKKKFQVYLRKGGSGRGPRVN